MQKTFFIRFLMTIGITLSYCCLWMIVEMLYTGTVTDNPVDDIMMLLFIPMIYLATGSFCNFIFNRKEL